MRFDAHGLEVLERRECIELLGSVPLGRVVFTDRALPAIQPVNFVLDGDDVILRTAAGSKLGVAMRGAIVAFEADAFDDSGHTGWSVTVLGQARVVNHTDEIARLSRLRLGPQAAEPSDQYIRISGGHISGRRISPEPYTAGRSR